MVELIVITVSFSELEPIVMFETVTAIDDPLLVVVVTILEVIIKFRIGNLLFVCRRMVIHGIEVIPGIGKGNEKGNEKEKGKGNEIENEIGKEIGKERGRGREKGIVNFTKRHRGDEERLLEEEIVYIFNLDRDSIKHHHHTPFLRVVLLLEIVREVVLEIMGKDHPLLVVVVVVLFLVLLIPSQDRFFLVSVLDQGRLSLWLLVILVKLVILELDLVV